MRPLRESITLLVILGPTGYLAYCWRSLPPMLPSHFGLDGQPNRFAPRSFVWVLVAASIFVYLFLSVIARFPSKFNLSKPPGDPDRLRLETYGVELVSWLRLEIACLFAYTLWSVLRTADRQSEGLGAWFTVVALAVILSTVGFYLWRMRQPDQPHLAH